MEIAMLQLFITMEASRGNQAEKPRLTFHVLTPLIADVFCCFATQQTALKDCEHAASLSDVEDSAAEESHQ